MSPDPIEVAVWARFSIRSPTVTRSAAALNVSYGMILIVASKAMTTTTAKAPATSNAFCHQLSRLSQRSRSPRKGSYSVEYGSGCGASSSSVQGSLPPALSAWTGAYPAWLSRVAGHVTACLTGLICASRGGFGSNPPDHITPRLTLGLLLL